MSASGEEAYHDSTILTCLRWLRELLQLAPARLVPQFAQMLQVVLPHRGSANPAIASAATQLLQEMRHQLAEREAAQPGSSSQGGLRMESLLEVVATCLEGQEEGSEVVKLEALQWLQLLLLQRDAVPACSADAALLAALFEALGQSVSDRVVNECLGVLCSVAAGGQERFEAVLLGIIHCFRGAGGARLLQRRGSIIIQQFSESLGAEKVFVQLSYLLAEEKDQGFVSALVQALNLILLTCTSLLELRNQLRMRSREGLFAALWTSWATSISAALSLAFLAEVGWHSSLCLVSASWRVSYPVLL